MWSECKSRSKYFFVLFNNSLLCAFGVFWHLFVVRFWCNLVPPFYVFLVFFNISLLCVRSVFVMFLCYAFIVFVFIWCLLVVHFFWCFLTPPNCFLFYLKRFFFFFFSSFSFFPLNQFFTFIFIIFLVVCFAITFFASIFFDKVGFHFILCFLKKFVMHFFVFFAIYIFY
jgi:hypothetical protein